MDIKCGDEILRTLPETNTGDEFFLNKKIFGGKKIELIDSNNKKLEYKQDESKLYEISEKVINRELENMKKAIETITKKKESNIQVFLIFNINKENSDRIDTNKIESNEKLKNLKNLMNCLKDKLSDSIELINENDLHMKKLN